MDPIRTTCPYCGTGCGLLVQREADGSVRVAGDPLHPANFGRLCSKGAALGETLDLEGRLLHPEIGGERVSWSRALEFTAGRLQEIITRHGPDAVAFYVSGQLLTEDYYVANKLMKGFIGSANIDSNSRLCMASAVAGHKRAFGSDTVPGCYADLEQADLVLVTGSNLAWCHPVLYQRLMRAREERGTRVVIIDPRRTATCDGANLHLPLRPGSDAVLFNGLLHDLHARGAMDQDYVTRHTQGLEAALTAARASAGSVTQTANACGLETKAVETLFTWVRETPRLLTLFSQGINQSSSGTDKVNAILNLHLLTGRIGKPGAGPFSVTGQPNAMGGREVGALANQLAAHMDFDAEDIDRVGRFWAAERMATRPGLKAVEMFDAVASGQVKAIWIMATNPVVSLPQADRVRTTLRGCDLVIVSDCVRHTDTTECADVLLPALTWGEKSGTVTNSERRISRQRQFLPPPGEAKPDWWIISQLASRMGFADAFAYETPHQIFTEHAALSGFENTGRRAFNIGALRTLDSAAYRSLAPQQWPVNGQSGRERFFAHGGFHHRDRAQARFVAVTPQPPQARPDHPMPLTLNTGRTRDHWHTMTRTGKSARLSAHQAEPQVEMHPIDAIQAGVVDGDLVRVSAGLAGTTMRLRVTDGQRPGSLFAPMHWSGPYASQARVGVLIPPVTDPYSGQPELKHAVVGVSPLASRWQGYLLSREPLTPRGVEHWSRARIDGGWATELAGATPPKYFTLWAQHLLQHQTVGGEWIEFHDPASGRYRAAQIVQGQLQGCLFVSEGRDLPGRTWLGQLLAHDALDAGDRAVLLSGRPPSGTEDHGRTVCACFGVGLHTLQRFIAERPLINVAEIGELLKAGTNCGSCIPELRALLSANARSDAA